jgi:hypothetical protein
MRTLILALTVLLFAAPVWATVTITTEIDDANDKKVWIGYTSDEAELVRAFALDITATDGNILAVEDYAIGDDNGGFGIFPGTFAGSITVNPTTGMVDNWNVAGYSPVAPAGDPDALGGIGTGGATVEMGSLYDTAAPSATEGILCSVTVDENVTEVCVSANAIRGNVVLESAAEVQDLVLPPCLGIPGGECFPSSDPGYNDWVAFGKPECWCYARQCHGDADGKKQGNPFTGYEYVGGDDLLVLIAGWQVKEPDKGPGILSVENGICADFNHAQQGNPFTGYERVGGDDLNVLIAHWQVKEPDKGPGVPPDCVPNPVEPAP